MYKYKVLLKNGESVEADCKWLDSHSIHNILCDHQPFIQIGETVFAKDSIAMIQYITGTTEKEN